MSNKMQVTVKMDQQLAMSQQLRQAITLLQYNTLDLRQLVAQHLEQNPLLEVEETDEDAETNSIDNEPYQATLYSASLVKSRQYTEDESALENFAVPESLRNHLLNQTLLCQFNPQDQVIAEAIIDAIDDDGHLSMSLDEIRNLSVDESIKIEHMEALLKIIQTFDPVGVGSRNIRECLLVQLEFLSDQDKTWHVAHQILSDFFDTIASNNVKQLSKMLDVTPEEYQNAMTLIRTLNPHPGIQFSSETNFNVEPELYVKKTREGWQVFLADSILTNIKINKQYQALIRQNKKQGSYQSLRQELDEARSLLSGLKRRNETLLSVASYIVEMQQEFLEHGPSSMKPMNIIDVSQALNIHESTVSRITTGKYIATPTGVFELKYFFPSHIKTNSGDTCSAIAVKEYIKQIIKQEAGDHILSDEEIAALLREKGLNIARRTVAKYREALKILPSYQRSRMQPA
jgi:RNA polymerase sigma-54 factor